MTTLLSSVAEPAQKESVVTPVPPSAKKAKVTINLGSDCFQDEEDCGSNTDQAPISVTNPSGFAFKWRDAKRGKEKVTGVITLPSGIDPADCSINLQPDKQNELCSDELIISYK